ncbi:MAG: hypothetical protein GAK31_00397 [Stenotrophomonas maltophilia]|uniref:Uncharacterized protein n=1 Tax=Stenotrophomonas maltophilia TaxID=40324 RepID=A0A7V8FJC9_STEMA|nr:MAG: hypothetical protein GAK31_00397 [Stenotrophomonas maltophilia]
MLALDCLLVTIIALLGVHLLLKLLVGALQVAGCQRLSYRLRKRTRSWRQRLLRRWRGR